MTPSEWYSLTRALRTNEKPTPSEFCVPQSTRQSLLKPLLEEWHNACNESAPQDVPAQPDENPESKGEAHDPE